MCGKYSLTKFANVVYYSIACGNCWTFGSTMVAISTRNTKMQKICELRKAIFSVFSSILNIQSKKTFSSLRLSVWFVNNVPCYNAFHYLLGWDDEEGLLAAVLAESQKEYLDSLKRNMKDNETNNKGPSPKN